MMRRNCLILSLACVLVAHTTVRGQQTLSFSTTDAGVTKSVAAWGIDAAWPSFDNVRQSYAAMGVANVEMVRISCPFPEPLVDDGDGTYSLNARAKAEVDQALSLVALGRPGTAINLVAANDADPGLLAGNDVNVDRWVWAIRATQEYIASRPGFTNTPITYVEAFNEPDYWPDMGSPANLQAAITQLRAVPAFAETEFLAGSTLNSDWARWWYDQIPAATGGSSHLLGGSLTSYVDFMKVLESRGQPFVNLELHSLGEAIVGAEYGMDGGSFWADALRARGLFVQASDGKRLAYAEDLGRQSAAAVYRAPDGNLYAFAGGLERFGSRTSYRFVATDRDVFFNGIPVREYMLQTKQDETASNTDNDFANYGSWSHQGAFAEIDTEPGAIPALDGYRWKVVNKATGQVMEVAGGSLADGGTIRSAADTGGLAQKWDIVRTRDGLYELFNANSGKTAEVGDWSLVNGGSVRQWGTADNQLQQWLIEDAGGGSVYLRNAYSLKYLTGSATSATQYGLTGSALQKWRFVLANPTDPPLAHFAFDGNLADAAGGAAATLTGAPAIYTAGPPGSSLALRFDGVNDSLQLPASVAQSADITISATLKWDGGASWQRIFDFGNDTSSYMYLTPRSGGGTMRFAISKNGGGEEVLETAALPVGEWVNLTLTIGGQTGILYIDGKPRVAGQLLLDPAAIAPTLNYIGKSQFPDPLFRGEIADFRVYDYALHMSQVASFMQPCWNGDVSSNWSTAAANWLVDAAPQAGRDGDAVLFNDLAANFTVNVTDAAVRPGSIVFDHTYNDYTLAGGGGVTGTTGLTKRGAATLTIRNTNSFTGATRVEAGTLAVATAGALAASPVTVAPGGTLAVAVGTTMRAPAVTLDGGTLAARTVSVRATTGITRLAINSGSLSEGMAVSVGAGGVLSLPADARLSLGLGSLAVDAAAGGVLDLGLGEVTVAAGGATASGLRTALLAGRNGGAWNGTSGLVSTAIAAAPAGTRTIGYALVTDGSARVSYAAPGDANLNGQVDVFDLVTVNAAARYGTGGAAVWAEGDVNYDGVTNVFDLVGVNAGGAYGAGQYLPATISIGSLPAGVAAAGIAPVPEPGAATLATVAGAILALGGGRRLSR